ncbi:hypothetical protein AK830_g1220 [Neonectria ditissima]|uniref:Thioesterase domain-containing protein n=1 Tax=Neonectria ditissima TaxID=78410 RepID=A0A0P7BNJ5_9HYPO|nr:hypothetical protein AK830_g1220 [Neonectria ditissima]
MPFPPSFARIKHRGPFSTLSRLIAIHHTPPAPFYSNTPRRLSRSAASYRALHTPPPASPPMSPPISNRLICPELGLCPSETPPGFLDKELAFFNAIPWTAALLEAPDAIAFVPPCRNPVSDAHDQLFGCTLANDRAVKQMLCLLRAKSRAAALDPTRAITEIETLISVGDGVSGFPNVVHGGIVASLLDESMGAVFDLNVTLGKEARAFQSNNVTGALNVTYLKPVPTNSVLHITVKVEEMNGRKTKIQCDLKDENHAVLAKCSSTWVALKPSL